MLFGQISLYYYITKVLPHLTLYRLKDKKEVSRLTSPYRLKTMAQANILINDTRFHAFYNLFVLPITLGRNP
jgi:hypothetical protein